jgi:hypothetical protein
MPERKDLIEIFKAETEEHLTRLDSESRSAYPERRGPGFWIF